MSQEQLKHNATGIERNGTYNELKRNQHHFKGKTTGFKMIFAGNHLEPKGT